MDKIGAVVTGGFGPEKDYIFSVLQESSLIVAADSGWDLSLSYGIIPDIFIGDMDSVTDKSAINNLPADRRILHPVDKDFTDTELAVDYLFEQGYRNVTLVGGGGGRLDHTLGILNIFRKQPHPVRWITDTETITPVETEEIFRVRKGQTISIFPIGEYPCIISTSGLKWELKETVWEADSCSLSNVSVGTEVKVRLFKGKAAVIINNVI